MTARWHAISAHANAALLEQAVMRGPRVEIITRLGPALWREVKLILEKLGAVYVVGTSAFEFEPDQDARTIVRAALTSGKVMGQAGAFGFVATPPDLVEHVLALYARGAVVAGGRTSVLEPSAGTGRFVEAIHEMFGTRWTDVTAVEPEERRARQIPRQENTTVVPETFEEYAARAQAERREFELIVMNPPFSVPGRATLWAEHLLLAWTLLAPGGRLVAILPHRVLEQDRRRLVADAQSLVHWHGEGHDLGDEEFLESGVKIRTAVVSLDRPLADTPLPIPVVPRDRAQFRTYTPDDRPVAVRRPFLTRRAALTMPVQSWVDSWRNVDRILRFRAYCAGCTRPVWGFDDGENDPRGVLGEASAAFSVYPFDDGLEEMPIGLCAICGGEREHYERAYGLARSLWDASDAVLAPPSVPASPATPSRSSPEQLMLGF